MSLLDKLGKGGSSAKKIDADINANPYLNARRSWNEHVGSVINSRQIWQAVALISLMISLAAVGGVIFIGSQSKYIPYIVSVDSLGQVAASGRADRASSIDERSIHAAVANFVSDARMVSFDRNVQHDAIWRVYAMMQSSDPAAMKMTQFMKDPETSPTVRAEKESVAIEISSVLKQTPETWEIIWFERIWDRDGIQLAQYRMRGLVTVYLMKPSTSTTEEDIRRNPLGIYVRDYSWSRIAE